jgi:hypothetical protein
MRSTSSLSLKASIKSRERKIRRKPSPVCTHAQIKRKKKPPRCTEEEEEQQQQQQSSFLSFRQLDLEIHSKKSIKPTRFLSQKASRSSYEIERKQTQTHMIGKHQHPV